LELKHQLLEAALISFNAGRMVFSKEGSKGSGFMLDVFIDWAAQLSTPELPLDHKQIKGKWDREKKLWKQVKWLVERRSGTTIDRERGMVVASDVNWLNFELEFRTEAMTWLRTDPFFLPGSRDYDTYLHIFHRERATGENSLTPEQVIASFARERHARRGGGSRGRSRGRTRGSSSRGASRTRAQTDDDDDEVNSAESTGDDSDVEELTELPAVLTAAQKRAEKRQAKRDLVDPTVTTALDDSDASVSLPTTYTKKASKTASLAQSNLEIAQSLRDASLNLSAHEDSNVIGRAMADFVKRFEGKVPSDKLLRIYAKLNTLSEARLYNGMSPAMKELWMQGIADELGRQSTG
jgi:hypothetical protein